jgi:hypothetical protein
MLAVFVGFRSASIRRCDETAGSRISAGNIAGRGQPPTFLIGILLILVFAVQGRSCRRSGAAMVALGWWTTGLLTRAGSRR